MNSEIRDIAIVDEICDVAETCQPFGKRYGQQLVLLSAEHLAALQAGKLLALDAQGEYVVFIGLEKTMEGADD